MSHNSGAFTIFRLLYVSFVLYDVSFFGNLTSPLPIKLIQIMFGVPGEKIATRESCHQEFGKAR